MRWSETTKYTLSGVVFGLTFPLGAWILDILSTGLSLSPGSVLQIHQNNIVHFVVDLAPLVLGIVFYYLGRTYQQALHRNYFSSLEDIGPTSGSILPFRLASLAAVLIILLLLGASSWYVQRVIRLQTQAEIGDTLRSVLLATEQAAYFKYAEEQNILLAWAKTDVIVRATKDLILAQEFSRELLESPAQASVRAWYEPIGSIRHAQGYFIISPRGINLASSDMTHSGEISLLSQHPDFLENIWRGRTALSTPHHSHTVLPGLDGKDTIGLITMFVGAPIIGASGEVIAALVLRLDPHASLSPILRLGRRGESGENYAFIREGEIITESRFDEKFDRYGIRFFDEAGTAHLEVRDPGVNLTLGELADLPRHEQPFTRMARSAMAGESGQDLEGYRDYRGVPVIGSWLWSDRLGFGLAVEIDVSEAYVALNFTRNTIAVTFAILGVISLGFLALLFKFLAESRQARNTLTENDQKTRLLLNSTGEAIYGIDLNGECTFANRSCLELLGYTAEEELIGHNMHTLIHHTHNDGTPYPVEECKIYQAHREEVPSHVEDEVLWRADGSSFDSEYRSFPMYHRGEVIGSVVSFTDISRRITLEKEQQLSEDRFQNFFDIYREGIIFHDKGVIRDVNPRAEEIFGYALDEIVGHNVLELIAPESKKSALEFAAKLKLEDKQGLQLIGQRKDGSKMHLDTFRTGHLYEGKLQTVLFINDISTQVEDQARHRTIVENMKDALITISETGIIESFNPAAESLFGYSAEEIVGRNISHLMPEPHSSQHTKNVERYVKTGEAHILGITGIDVEGLRKNGESFPLSITISEMFVGGKRIFSGVIRDMTEKLALEKGKELVAAELRQLIDNANAPIFGVGIDGRLNEWNKQVAKLTGFSKQEVLGRDVIEDLIEGGDTKLVRELLGSAMKGKEFSNLRFTLHTKEPGGFVELFVNVSTRRNMNGDITGILVLGQDVTELREKERALNQAQKMEAIGQLTGGIAHDFNNLLSIINGNLRFLRQDVGQTNIEIDELFEDAMSAVEDGAELTQRLLTFSRTQPLRSEIKNVNESIEKSARFLSRTLGENIELDIDVPAEGLFVRVDTSQLKNALLNLCINARDAMPEGGTIVISASHCHRAEGDSVLSEGEYIVISVSDSGTGISTKDLQHVFEPFFTTKDVGQGSGLGLSMVYAFTQQSRGCCEIESVLGRGTTVSMYFPRETEDQTLDLSSHKAQQDETLAYEEVILVVEDEPRVRRVTLRDLQKLGFKTLEAENAAVAKEIIESGEHIDLLFSDVLMPGEMDGHMLGLWTEGNYPGIKVVLTSGYSKSKSDIGRDRAHPFPMIRKPYTIEKLDSLIRATLLEPT